MSVRVEVEQDERLEEALEVLLPVEPHLAYANFLPVARRPGAAVALHRARWRGGDDLGVLVARDDGDRPLAALRLEPRPFESAHFELAMARIEPPLGVADDATRDAGLAALYPAALEQLAQRGIEHVAARASTRDRAAPWRIQAQGGVHVDTQVSWMAALTGQPCDESVPPPLRMEMLDSVGIARLDPAAWKRLAQWSGRAFDRGPLVFDRSLPHDRALAVYEAWTERVMRGDWADAVLVAWDGPEIVAFISMQVMDDVSAAAGQKVCGRGLGATLPEYRGLFTAIQREMVAERPLGARYMENETQIATLGSINVYAKLGFRYLRSTATFHLRPGSPLRACG